MSRSVSWMQIVDKETSLNIKLACAFTGMTMKEFVRAAIVERIKQLPPEILAKGGFDFRLYEQNRTMLSQLTIKP